MRSSFHQAHINISYVMTAVQYLIHICFSSVQSMGLEGHEDSIFTSEGSIPVFERKMMNIYRISCHAESMKPSAGGLIVHDSLVDQIPSGCLSRSTSAVIGSSRDCMRLVKSSEDLTDETRCQNLLERRFISPAFRDVFSILQ